MIRILCAVIDKEIVKVAKQISKKMQTDVMIETHEEYMEIHPEEKK